MTKEIYELKALLGKKRIRKSHIEFDKKISLFELQNSLKLPIDLIEYFKLQYNAKNEIDKDLFQFYSFDQFKSIENGLAQWGGVPDYRNIVNTLNEFENCFVFAEYMSHLFVYAIRLYKDSKSHNEIYMICGDKYKKLANTFSEFLNLYFDDSEELKNI